MRLFVAVVTAALVGPLAHASVINFANTPGGVYNTGVPGSTYTFAYTGPSAPFSGTAVTASPGNFPFPNYPVTTPTSQWVLTQANPPGNLITDPAGVYTFSTQFTLPAGLISALISGRVSADNSVLGVSVNGAPEVPLSGGGHNAGFIPFSVTSGFQPGLNTLTFRVRNDPQATGNPVALNVQIASAQATTPEPLSLVVFGGLVVGGVVAVRRRMTRA